MPHSMPPNSGSTEVSPPAAGAHSLPGGQKDIDPSEPVAALPAGQLVAAAPTVPTR